jgi:hypothetical protein
VPLFNDQTIPMYSFGMTNRDIKSHLEQGYNGEVPPEPASRVTDAVMEDAREWQSRPLEKSYAIVYLDALRVNSRAGREKLPKERARLLGSISRGKRKQAKLRFIQPVDSGKRRGEVPGAGAQWDTQPGDTGHPDSAHGRAFRVPGRGAGSIPPDAGAAAHRTHGAQSHGVRREEAGRAALNQFAVFFGEQVPLLRVLFTQNH